MRDRSAGRTVHIHYHRPPDRTDRFVQKLIFDDNRTKVTFATALRLDAPLRIGGRPVLDRGSDVVWFTFPGAWHDIGRFHLPDGRLTGIYANILTPCLFEPGEDWHTTDLFLDLWIPAEELPRRPGAGPGEGLLPHTLDCDELDTAEREGWVSATKASRARREAERLTSRARVGRWPPPIVGEWTRERARSVLSRVERPSGPPAAGTHPA